MNFNLIITCGRDVEFDTVLELKQILKKLNLGETIWKSGLDGIIYAKTDGSPYTILEKLREHINEKPWEFNLVRRIIPIEMCFTTDLRKIIREAVFLSNRIRDDETYRITIEKRGTKIKSEEIIEGIANQVNRKVSLEYPDKALLIEIMNDRTGLSLISGQNGILNVNEELLK